MVKTFQYIITFPEEIIAQGKTDCDTVFAFDPSNVQDEIKTIALWMVILDKSCILWLGSVGSTPDLQSLIVGMYSKSLGPMTSTLIPRDFSSPWDDAGDGLAQRISRKFNIQTFISDNMPALCHQPPFCHYLEKSIVDFLSEHFEEPTAG